VAIDTRSLKTFLRSPFSAFPDGTRTTGGKLITITLTIFARGENHAE